MKMEYLSHVENISKVKKNIKISKILKTAIVAICCALLAFIFLFPVIWMLSNSFKDNDTVNRQLSTIWTFFPPSWNITEWFVSYIKLFNSMENFGQSILNSILYCSVMIVSVLVINSLSGYALAKIRFPGNKLMTTIILVLMIIPIETSIVPTYLVLYYLGLLAKPLNVIGYLLPSVASLFYTYMFRQYFLGMPVEIEEAARIDGCSRIGVFFKMIVPLSKPIFATVAIFTFMGQWNEYIFAQLMFPTTDQQPLQVFLQVVNSAAQRDIGMVMASLTISTIPIAIVYIFCQKYIVEGVSFTGLK
ncbi:MAG: carbohydrate ABC transporter permease [Bacilli bacterium]